LIFAEAEADYIDHRLDPGEKNKETGEIIRQAEFPSLKPNTPFGQVPILEVDGVVIAQSITIFRYLARRYHLYGKTEIEGALADMVVDEIVDIANGYAGAKTPEEKQKFVEEFLPKHAQFLENILKKNGEYFTGNFTYADIVVANRYYSLLNDFGPEVAKVPASFPLLTAHYQRVMSRPNIAKWVKDRPASKF